MDLGFAFAHVALLEEHVVITVAVERRVEIDEVDRLVGERAVLAQPAKVVAKVEEVGPELAHHRGEM